MKITEKNFHLTAVIAAAGNSSRMNLNKSKQTIMLNGMSVISRSIKAFEESNKIRDIIIVCRDSERSFIESEIKKYGFEKVYRIVRGGETRQQSVFNGISAAKSTTDYFAVHDGARCFVKTADIDRVIDDAIKYKAAALAVKVKDTVKVSDKEEFINTTVDREPLRLVQTPQVFEKGLYFDALKKAKSTKNEFTDDCQLIENIGVKVKLTEGSYGNIKITKPDDLESFNENSGDKIMYKIGHGYDVHRLVKGRKLILGGAEIEHITGLLGHSDADVLTHAVMDSLLGAAGMGDIGHLFPDNDETYKGAYSINLLRIVCKKIREADFEIENMDITVIAQEPKLAPYIDEMKSNIVSACSIGEKQVNIKATTEEGLGFSGKKEGIAAHCICLLHTV